MSRLATNERALSLSQANSIVHGVCANPACTSGSHDAGFCADPLCPHAHLGPHFAVESDCTSSRVRVNSSWRAMGGGVLTFLGLDASSAAAHQLKVSAVRRHSRCRCRCCCCCCRCCRCVPACPAPSPPLALAPPPPLLPLLAGMSFLQTLHRRNGLLPGQRSTAHLQVGCIYVDTMSHRRDVVAVISARRR